MPTTFSALRATAAPYRLVDWGDEHEQKAADFIAAHIPAYEKFWQALVLPFRGPTGVWLRLDLVPSHEAICIHNYSTFRALIRAHTLLEEARVAKKDQGEVGSDLFYDYCLWLVVAVDRIDQMAGALYFYLYQPADSVRRGLKNWKDNRRELSARFAKDVTGDFSKHAARVKLYRNNIAHGIKFPGGKDRVPRESELLSLLYWSEWAKLAQSSATDWLARTIDRLDLMEDLWKEAVPAINQFMEDTLTEIDGQFGATQLPDQNKASLHKDTVVSADSSGRAVLLPKDPSAYRGPSSGSTYPPSLS